MNQQAQQLLNKLREDIRANRIILPSLPEVALRVRQLTSDNNSSINALEQEITKDAAIAARLLKVANSSALTRGSPITSLKQAIMSLGMALVRSLVTQLAILQTMQAGYNHSRLQGFVASSLQISSLSYTLADKFPHLDSELAALAGLLHDIGKLPLRSFLEQQEHLAAKDCLKYEQLLHPAVGAMMLKHWNMPNELVAVALRHEDILRDTKKALPDYTDLIICANIMHYGLDKGRYSYLKDENISALNRCKVDINNLTKQSSTEQRMSLALAMINS